MRSILLALLAAVSGFAQPTLPNPGFEQGEIGSVPTGWFTAGSANHAAFRSVLTDEECRTGAKCVLMTTTGTPPENMFNNLMLSFPAAGLNLRKIRLRGAVRVEGAGTRVQFWLRFDRADQSMAFLENMQARPITSTEWGLYDIEASVPSDAARLALGVMQFGSGKAWVDDMTLTVEGEVVKDASEPARPLTANGLTNLRAFARLYGYLRFFHPSDQAAAADWDTFAVVGVRKVEDAATAQELIARLQALVDPVAPTVRLHATGRPPASSVSRPADADNLQMIRYTHNGVELPSMGMFNIYKSRRNKTPASGVLPAPFSAELAPGVSLALPLALYIDSKGTFPHRDPAGPGPLYERTAGDRATRLAGVIIAWNIFQHFYPYFDVVKTDWAEELPKALRTAATDDPASYVLTLRRLVAALKDGHGGVNYPSGGPFTVPPVNFDWIEDELIITGLRKDGKPTKQARAEVNELISAASPGWMRSRSRTELTRCNASKRMRLEVEPYASPGTSKSVEVDCGAPSYKQPDSYPEPRGERIRELEPGIVYVDLDRVTPKEWTDALPRLEQAKGIIFDMRGYPGQPGITSLAHLTDTPLRSAKWNIPEVTLPDRADFQFKESGWPVQPLKPYLSARRAFLIDGRAISYAETVMGIVEHFKLGAIIGEPTAGTNGNVNPFRLPGGYTISWTGMKVLKHDGSQHHGVGIRPTIPAARTRKGVAEGKDEVLLKGMEAVRPQ